MKIFINYTNLRNLPMIISIQLRNIQNKIIIHIKNAVLELVGSSKSIFNCYKNIFNFFVNFLNPFNFVTSNYSFSREN